MEKATRWFLRHRCGDMASVVERYRAVLASVATMLGEAGGEAHSAEILTHLGLSARAPPRAFDRFQLA